MSLKYKRKKYRESAIKVLEQSHLARNYDWCFIFNFLYVHSNIKIPREIRKQIYESKINIHTILRERQKIQSEGKYLPTNEAILERRKKLAKEYSENYKKNKEG